MNELLNFQYESLTIPTVTNVVGSYVDNKGIVNQYYGAGNPVDAASFERNRSHTYCNIFIVKGEKFNVGVFQIPRVKEDSEKYDDPRFNTYPSLFMDVNHGEIHGLYHCSQTQQFYYGRITLVMPIGNNVRICFEKLTAAPLFQERLNGIAKQIGIQNEKGADLLNHTGWLVRKIDIVKVLQNNGFVL